MKSLSVALVALAIAAATNAKPEVPLLGDLLTGTAMLAGGVGDSVVPQPVSNLAPPSQVLGTVVNTVNGGVATDNLVKKDEILDLSNVLSPGSQAPLTGVVGSLLEGQGILSPGQDSALAASNAIKRQILGIANILAPGSNTGLVGSLSGALDGQGLLSPGQNKDAVTDDATDSSAAPQKRQVLDSNTLSSVTNNLGSVTGLVGGILPGKKRLVGGTTEGLLNSVTHGALSSVTGTGSANGVLDGLGVLPKDKKRQLTTVVSGLVNTVAGGVVGSATGGSVTNHNGILGNTGLLSHKKRQVTTVMDGLVNGAAGGFVGSVTGGSVEGSGTHPGLLGTGLLSGKKRELADTTEGLVNSLASGALGSLTGSASNPGLVGSLLPQKKRLLDSVTGVVDSLTESQTDTNVLSMAGGLLNNAGSGAAPIPISGAQPIQAKRQDLESVLGLLPNEDVEVLGTVQNLATGVMGTGTSGIATSSNPDALVPGTMIKKKKRAGLPVVGSLVGGNAVAEVKAIVDGLAPLDTVLGGANDISPVVGETSSSVGPVVNSVTASKRLVNGGLDTTLDTLTGGVTGQTGAVNKLTGIDTQTPVDTVVSSLPVKRSLIDLHGAASPGVDGSAGEYSDALINAQDVLSPGSKAGSTGPLDGLNNVPVVNQVVDVKGSLGAPPVSSNNVAV